MSFEHDQLLDFVSRHCHSIASKFDFDNFEVNCLYGNVEAVSDAPHVVALAKATHAKDTHLVIEFFHSYTG